ncbi:hypothetical protein KEM54_006654 [Ascosphaera aggregata]|nr:hypothetical protein KEM54_006654 [Ascosphaera aggregata]
MAPLMGAYFPSLDDCFSGDAQLISWNAAHLQILSIEEGSSALDGLVSFINSSEGQRILINPLHPFPPASPDTTVTFESKLSSSSVASQKQVDLSQIKSDALWLSKKCNIDEVSALRIVVLQWQDQSAAQLLTNFSEEEVTSLQDAVGIGGVSQPAGHARIVSALQKHRGDLNPRPEGLSEEDDRHLKIWLTYLSERQSILSTFRRLLCLALKHVLPACLNGHVRAERNSDESPLEEFCRSNYNIPAEGDKIVISELISLRDCTDAIATRMRSLGAGSGSLIDDVNGDIETAWITYHLEEILQILQILYQLLQTTNGFVSDTLLVSWLRLMVDYNFLEGLCPATPQQLALYPPIQATVAAINLAFLKLPLAKAKFDDIAQSTMTHVTDWKTNSPFFLSKTSIAEINEIYMNAAAAGIRTAGPAVLAWCIIMFAVREFGLRASHERELQQLEHPVDASAEGEVSVAHQESVAATSEFAIFEDAIERIKGEIHDDDFVQALFADVVNECNVFEVITRIVEASESLDGFDSDRLMCCWVVS